MAVVSINDPNVVPHFNGIGRAYIPPAELQLDGPGVWERMGRGILQENWMASWFFKEPLSGKFNPAFNVWEKQDPSKPFNEETNPFIHMAGFEEFRHLFTDVRHEEDVEIVKENIRRELRNRQVLEHGGLAGIIGRIIGGSGDPIVFIPSAKLITVGRSGVAVGKSLGVSTFAAGSIMATQEAILHEVQAARTQEETVFAITGGTVLGGLLGLGLASLSKRAITRHTKDLQKILDERRVMAMAQDDAPPLTRQPNAPDVLAPDGLRIDLDKVDTLTPAQRLAREVETVDGVKVIPKEKKVPRAFMALNRFISARVEGATSKATPMRRWAQRLMQLPFAKLGAVGVDAESISRLDIANARTLMVEVENLHARMVTSDPTAVRSIAKRAIDFREQSGAFPLQKFKEEVVTTMRGVQSPTGKIIGQFEHEVPEVNQAAKLLFENHFKPMAERAVASGLLPKEVLESPTWMMRLYNHRKLRQRATKADGTEHYPEQDAMVKALVEHEAARAIAENRLAEFKIDDATKAAKGVIEEILSTPDIRMLGSVRTVPLRSPMLQRTLNVPDSVLAPWLVNDLERLVMGYSRSMAGDIAIAELTGLSRGLTAIEETQPTLVAAVLKAENTKQAARIIAARDKTITTEFGGSELKKAFKRGWVSSRRVFPDGDPTAATRDRIPITISRIRLAQRIRNAKTQEDAMKALTDRDSALIRRFSSGDAPLVRDQVNDWWTSRIKAIEQGPLEDIGKLQRQRTKDLNNLTLITNVVRHLHNIPPDPTSITPRLLRGARQSTVMAVGGTIGLSSIPDIAQTMMNFGIRRFFRDALVPLLTDWQALRLAIEQAKDFKGPAEIITNTRTASLFDLIDDFTPHTKFERGMTGATKAFSIANLSSPWNTVAELLTSMTAISFILRSARKMNKGGVLSRNDLIRLGELGLNENLLRRIGDQWDQFGGIGGKKRFSVANTTRWTDEDAVLALRVAGDRASNLSILKGSPLDRPRIPGFSEEMTRVVTLFMNFSFAANTRILTRAIQYRDARVLSGLTLMVTLGMLSVYLKEMAKPENRRRMPKNLKEWVGRGIDQSGALGIMYDGSEFLARMTGGDVSISAIFGDRPRRYSVQNGFEALFGPVASQIVDAAKFATGVMDLDPEPRDITALRHLIWMNNVVGVRRPFDKLEDIGREAVED